MRAFDYTLYGIIRQNARTNRDRVAWVCGKERITFLDYFNQVEIYAHRLNEKGIKIGDRIAIIARNCLDYAYLFGACSKLGAILVPLNWRQTNKEIESILYDSRPRLLFIESEFQQASQGLEEKCSFLEGIKS